MQRSFRSYRFRLRVDTRLKLLEKWDPKSYGERVQTEHRGTPVGDIVWKLNG